MPMAYDLNLREYWRTMRKRKGIIIFTIVTMTVFSFVFSILGRPTPIYKTSASVKVERTGTVTGLYVQTVSWSTTNYMETQMALIKSYLILEGVAKKMGLIPPDISSEEARANPRYLGAILALKGKVDTEQEGNSDIINIVATSEDPKQAQRLANTVAQVYKEQHALNLNRRVIEAKKFIEGQLVVMRERLKKSEEAVKEYREVNRMVSLDARSSTLLSQLTDLQTKNDKYQATLARIDEVLALLAQAEDRPLSSKTIFYFEEASAPYKNLNERLVQLMMDRDLLLINYTENFPQVIQLKQQIHELISNMKFQLNAQKKSLSQDVAEVQKRIKDLDDQLRELPAKGLELARLERDAAVNREVYTLLEKQYQQSLIQDAEKIEEVLVVKPALEPTVPVNPPKTGATTGLGLVLGIILGVVFAFVVETFDTSIGAVEEVEDFLGVRVLGIVPHLNVEELKAELQETEGREIEEDRLWRIARLVSHFAPKTTAAESYRSLRTNINFVKLERDVKTIVLTSSSPQEGKTTVACNLAIAMAQAGNKVLLVDGDFRRPVLSKIFGIQAVPGLTDVILGNYEWRQVVRSITDLMMGKMAMEEIMLTPGLDNLFLITCGTIAPNPAELVSTKVTAEFLREAHEEYDFVIIDVPPVLAATDAAIWGAKSDGVIIVYQVGRVARGALKRAKAQIENVKAHIMGVVLNGLKAEISPDFDYHDKYYYYGQERKKKLPWQEKVKNLPELVKEMKKDFPGNLKKLLKEKLSAEAVKALIKLILLLLALALLIAGVYFQGNLAKPFKMPIKLGNVAAADSAGAPAQWERLIVASVFPLGPDPLPPGAISLLWEGRVPTVPEPQTQVSLGDGEGQAAVAMRGVSNGNWDDKGF